MNIIDIIILAVLAVSVAFALYRGFLASFLGAAACFVSLAVALVVGPRLAAALSANQGVTNLLATITDAGSMVSDYTLANTPVISLTPENIDTILKTIDLPGEYMDLLRQSMNSASPENASMFFLSDYITGTMVSIVLNTGSFILCFLLSCLALHLLISLISHVFPFPVLRHFDLLAAALMGLVRGAVILYVVMVTVPLIRAVIPFDLVDQVITESRLISLLSSHSLLLRVIGG